MEASSELRQGMRFKSSKWLRRCPMHGYLDIPFGKVTTAPLLKAPGFYWLWVALSLAPFNQSQNTLGTFISQAFLPNLGTLHSHWPPRYWPPAAVSDQASFALTPLHYLTTTLICLKKEMWNHSWQFLKNKHTQPYHTYKARRQDPSS